MSIREEFKKNVFGVVEDQMSLQEFEVWLYDQETLANCMDEDAILTAFAFNYRQKGAKYEFRAQLLSYFDKDEFLLWKVKTNLADLISGKNDRDRILNDFYFMSLDGYIFLQRIGWYVNEIDDLQYYSRSLNGLLNDLRQDCANLLGEIKRQERSKPYFKLMDFQTEI